MPEAAAETRADRRARYQQVLRTVAHNTGDPQSPGVRPFTLRTILAGHGSLEPDAVDSAITAALDNDDLLAWRDAAGDVRVTLQTIPDLRRLLEHLDGRLDAPDEALGRVKTAMREVRDA
jgi:hypothetical protein